MSKIKKVSKLLFPYWIFFILTYLEVANASEDISDGERVERAIFGAGSNPSDIVGGGEPGRDFPALHSIPDTDFSCAGRSPGYYADEEHGCQVFHICQSDRRKSSFLCPNGTIFNQLKLVCDWWYNVDCASTNLHVSVNDNFGKVSPTPRRENEDRTSSFSSGHSFAQNEHTSLPVSPNIKPSQQEHRRVGTPSVHDISNNVRHERIREQHRNQNADRDFTRQHHRGSVHTSPRPVVTTPAQHVTTHRLPSRSGIAVPALSNPNAVSGVNNIQFHTPVRSAQRRPSTTSRNDKTSQSVVPGSKIPDRLSPPKPGVPLFTIGDRQRGGPVRKTVSGRRVTVKKRPISSLSNRGTGHLQSQVKKFDSRPTPTQDFRERQPIVQQNVSRRKQNQIPSQINNKPKLSVDDRKVSTQFFNIGSPRVVPSRGVPLSATNVHSTNGAGGLRKSSISRVPPANRGSKVQTNFQSTQRQDSAVGNRFVNSGQGNLGHTGRQTGQTTGTTRLGSSRNVNRGSTTFQSSLKNRGIINHFTRNQNRGTFTRQPQSSTFGIVRNRNIDDLDDIFDDTPFDSDEILTTVTDDRSFNVHRRFGNRFDDDRFDDDRFDDDRFDDDRFDDDRFDDDRFDDDRFDLDDRFDDDRFDLDDRFDDDRFDNDRFDDDRFDDDRFDLDDRFDDDLDDRFDNDPFDDDRFDFRDSDERRVRFRGGNRFGRRAQGKSFVASVPRRHNSIRTPVTEPPQIQLPPPPL